MGIISLFAGSTTAIAGTAAAMPVYTATTGTVAAASTGMAAGGAAVAGASATAAAATTAAVLGTAIVATGGLALLAGSIVNDTTCVIESMDCWKSIIDNEEEGKKLEKIHGSVDLNDLLSHPNVGKITVNDRDNYVVTNRKTNENFEIVNTGFCIISEKDKKKYYLTHLQYLI